jgi:competence protein ComEA
MSDSAHPRWILRRGDQAFLAGLTIVCIVAMLCWIFLHGGFSGRMIEADECEPKTAKFQLDVNRAEVPELLQLPGIGNTLAQRIIESREKEGPYATIDDLRRVKGIGVKNLEHVRPYLLPIDPKKGNADTKSPCVP